MVRPSPYSSVPQRCLRFICFLCADDMLVDARALSVLIERIIEQVMLLGVAS
jgi:hypothetical protein